MQWGYKVMFWPWVCNVFSYPLAHVVWWFLYMQHAYASYAHLIEQLCTYIPLYTLLSSLPCLPICSDLFPSFPISFPLNRSPLLRLMIPGFAGNKLVNQPFRWNLLGMFRSTPSICRLLLGFFSKIVSWERFAPCFPDSPVTRTVTNPATNVGKTMS